MRGGGDGVSATAHHDRDNAPTMTDTPRMPPEARPDERPDEDPKHRAEPAWDLAPMDSPTPAPTPTAPAATPAAPANPHMVFCRACGHTIHITAPTCPKCGAPQRLAAPAPTAGLKSKVTAGLLAILIGGLGVHRFYLGQWWGLFYLLFVWTGIPGLVSFIEGIVFLASDQARWDERHNQGRSSVGTGGGAVVVAVVAVFVGIAMIGILAAIAVPAYHDYTQRAKSASAYGQLTLAGSAVADFIDTEQRLPATLDEAGYRDAPSHGVRELAIDPNTAVLTAWLDGTPERGLRFVPSREVGGAIEWQCEAIGLSEQQVPKACR